MSEDTAKSEMESQYQKYGGALTREILEVVEKHKKLMFTEGGLPADAVFDFLLACMSASSATVVHVKSLYDHAVCKEAGAIKASPEFFVFLNQQEFQYRTGRHVLQQMEVDIATKSSMKEEPKSGIILPGQV